MKISIVIASRNEDPTVLETTIAGIMATAGHNNLEIIVVDDGSRVPITDLPRAVQLVRNSSSLGVSHARRVGASVAKGDVLCWLDAHMSFGPGWLDELVGHVDESTLLCSAFWEYDLQTRHCYGADFRWVADRNYSDGRYPGFHLTHRVEEVTETVVDVPMIIGACYVMERGGYDRCGGFSPHLRIWGADEQDMSLRCLLAGMRVRCAARARVGHLSRRAFPYPVNFEHLEFNQMVLVRTLFEPETVRMLSSAFEPVPAIVRDWLDAAPLDQWREQIQARRVVDDATVFDAIGLPELRPQRRFIDQLRHRRRG